MVLKKCYFEIKPISTAASASAPQYVVSRYNHAGTDRMLNWSVHQCTGLVGDPNIQSKLATFSIYDVHLGVLFYIFLIDVYYFVFTRVCYTYCVYFFIYLYPCASVLWHAFHKAPQFRVPCRAPLCSTGGGPSHVLFFSGRAGLVGALRGSGGHRSLSGTCGVVTWWRYSCSKQQWWSWCIVMFCKQLIRCDFLGGFEATYQRLIGSWSNQLHGSTTIHWFMNKLMLSHL